MTGLQTSSCCLLDIYLIQAAGSNKGGKQQGNNKGIVESIHRKRAKITCCRVGVRDGIRLGRRSIDAWSGMMSGGCCRPHCRHLGRNDIGLTALGLRVRMVCTAPPATIPPESVRTVEVRQHLPPGFREACGAAS
jgi:hypothetical protein